MQIVTSVVSLSIVLVVGVFIARSQRAGAPTHVASTINLDAVPNPFGSNKNGSYQADIVDIGRTARGAIVKKVTFPGTLRKEHLATDAVYMILWPANVPTGKSLEAMYQEANNFIRKKGFGYVYTANAATEIANDKTNLPFNQKFPNIFFMQPEVLNDPQQLADIRAFEAAYNVTFRVAGDRPSTDNGVRLAPGRIMVYIVNSDAGIDIDLDVAKCSNAFMEGAEQCDDGNGNNNDGCSLNCTVETGYTCIGNPSVCTIGATAGATAGNTAGNTAGDTSTTVGTTAGATVGTTAGTTAENTAGTTAGTTVGTTAGNIAGATSGDLILCGNGDLDSGEQCDDGNPENGDGCTTSCGIETGYACRAIGDPICTQKICSDSDDGNDYVSKGTVEYTDFQSTSVSDACVTLEGGAYIPADYCLGTNCFVKEYYCTASVNMASEVISCNGYCNDGACISCGNGRIETGLGEQCDNGFALNGTESNDCRSDCKLVVPPAFGNQ